MSRNRTSRTTTSTPVTVLPMRPALLVLAIIAATNAIAADPASTSSHEAKSQTYAISASSLGEALANFAASAGVSVQLDSRLVEGRRSPGLNGHYTLQEGFTHLLSGTGLEVVERSPGTYVLRQAPAASNAIQAFPAVTVAADASIETVTGPVDGYIAKRSASGTKTDTPLIETPQSISVIGTRQIEATGANTVTEAVSYSPGVLTEANGYDTRSDWLLFRGFDAWEQGYFLDGLQLRNNNSFLTWRLEPYGAERIEILRGPSSVLYGQNIPGGTINAVSKRPQAEQKGEVRLRTGNYDRKEVAADSTGAIDSSNQYLYRLTALSRSSGTQVDYVSDDLDYVAPAFTWQPSDDTALTILASATRIRTSNTRGSLPVEGTLIETPAGRIPVDAFVGEPDYNHFDQDQWTLGYLFEHHLNDTWTLRQNLRYGEIEVDYQEIYSGSNGGNDYVVVNPADPDDPANFREMYRDTFVAQENGHLWTLDNQAQAQWQSGDWHHTLLSGLDFQRGRYTQNTLGGEAPTLNVYEPEYGADIPAPEAYSDADLAQDQAGFYLQEQAKFGERWAFTLGGRYDHFRNDADDHLYGDEADFKQSESDFTARAGVVYLTPAGVAPYLSYSESFSPVIGTMNPATFKPFDPERGRQYEAGLRFQPPARSDSYSMAIFDLRKKDAITYDDDGNPYQTGEITVQGLEVETLIEPFDGLTLLTSYTFTAKADITESADPAELGIQPNGIPKNMLSSWGDYRLNNGLKFGAGFRYVDSTRGRNDALPVEVPSYTLFDAMIGYDLEDWSLALNGRNLGDKVTLSRNCSAGACNYGQAREIVGSVTLHW